MFKKNFWNDFSQYRDRELYNLMATRSGGRNTIRIIDEILDKPKNANQIANKLNLDYKTVTYHLDIICGHDYLTREQFGRSYSYFPSDKLIRNIDEYYKIRESLYNEKR